MTRYCRTLLRVLVGAAILSGGTVWAQDGGVVKKGDNLVEVTVTGAGMDDKDALRDAQRKAVERGAGTFIYSQSETKDFALVRDTVLARSAGFIQSYEIISTTKNDDDTVTVKAKVVVSIKGIEDTWGVVQNFLKQMGRPKIMVFVNEKVDGVPSEDSTVQTMIEKRLLDSGFQLVNKEQIKAIDKKDLTAAAAEDKPDKLQAIAKKFGAQLFVSGSAEAGAAGVGEPNGVRIFKYGAKGNIKCYSSDTANMFSAENANEFSADRAKIDAADKALKALGEKIALKTQNDILRAWQDALEGRGEVKLEVDGITFKQKDALTDSLKAVTDITDVPEPEFHNKVAEYNLQAKSTAKELAKKLAKIDNLDITDVTQNVIKATFKAAEK